MASPGTADVKPGGTLLTSPALPFDLEADVELHRLITMV